MGSNYNTLSECECEGVLNKWLQEKCDDMDLVVVNDIPILIEDCLSILAGSVSKIKNSTNKLIITTTDNVNYVLESFVQQA